MQQENKGKSMGRGRGRTIDSSNKIQTNNTPVFPIAKSSIRYDYNNNHLPSFLQDQKKKIEDNELCKICDRIDGRVVCLKCGHEWIGRMKIKCQTHPNTIMSCDQDVCPSCKADVKNLKELKKED